MLRGHSQARRGAGFGTGREATKRQNLTKNNGLGTGRRQYTSMFLYVFDGFLGLRLVGLCQDWHELAGGMVKMRFGHTFVRRKI